MFGPDSLSVINTLATLVTLAVAVKALTKKDRVQEAVKIPQPLVTSKAPVHVTTEEFARLEGEVKELRTALESKLSDNNAAGEARAVEIHNRITPLSNKLHELAGQVGILVSRLTPRGGAKV